MNDTRALVDLLQIELASMTPRELMRFRAELENGLPEFVRETAERARQKASESTRRPRSQKKDPVHTR